jgi:ActR/RegA family two-component response regulator
MSVEKKQWQVLVVDDEPVWLDELAEILENAGYLARKAATYGEALQWLEREAFQLAVVDVNLADAPVDEKGEPRDTSGMDIISEIRQRAMEQDMSVIIVTGYGTFNVAREAFKKLGVLDVIPKQNFDLKEFRSLAADAISRTVNKMPGPIP